jgi:polyphosphate kinase
MKHDKFINREISWLSFNERVLQEAADPSVPVIERLRFLGIFSNNLDEFFRVRVATLKRVIELGKKAKDAPTQKPRKLMEEIQEIVIRQSIRFEVIYREILAELKRQNIYVIDEQHLTKIQGNFVQNYFIENVRPALVPIMLNQLHSFPYLKDKTIYLAIKLSLSTAPRTIQYALIEIPTDVVGRFVILPGGSTHKNIILLDDIIRYCLPEIFAQFKYDTYEAWTIKLTRDAELDIDNDISQSFIDKISRGVKARQRGMPVRFVYDQTIDKGLLQFLTGKMKLKKLDNLIPGGRYHNFNDFIRFPNMGGKGLTYEPIKTLSHPLLAMNKSLFNVLRERDVLLHYPYQRFSHFIDLLRDAAIDPDVKSIHITLYRVANKSMVVNALVNAAKNGKHVVAVVEVQARFDEEANIKWAKELQDEGIQVIYGVPGLKVHSKLCLIERLERGKLKRYANITTGNYNESTSMIYADDSLLTSNAKLTNEVAEIFEFFQKNFRQINCKHLILSPHQTRRQFSKLIDNEIENAKAGKPSGILLKLNSFSSEDMGRKLYEASRAGVKVRCIIRGISVLVPGLEGQSENIECISIIDKFLEHSRVMIFENAGHPLYFISSSDWMTRNLDNRIEVSTPVYDHALQKELRDMLEIQWADNIKARIMDADQRNQHRPTNPKNKVRAQVKIYDYLQQQSSRQLQTGKE